MTDYVLVPREMTREIYLRLSDGIYNRDAPSIVWNDLLEAAPKAPQREPLVEARGDEIKKMAKREPLSDEQLSSIYLKIACETNPNDIWHRAFARAIEEAHGIKEQA